MSMSRNHERTSTALVAAARGPSVAPIDQTDASPARSSPLRRQHRPLELHTSANIKQGKDISTIVELLSFGKSTS